MIDTPTNHVQPHDTLPTLAELGHDLTDLTTRQRWLTIIPPFVSVLAFAVFAYWGWWITAVLAAAAYTFFSYGSTSHDFVHRNLGLPRWLNELLLSVVELLGVRSGHAYRAAHLHHHQIFPDDDDVEAAAAHMSWVQALLSGPLHQSRVWWWAFRHARHDLGGFGYPNDVADPVSFILDQLEVPLDCFFPPRPCQRERFRR